MIKSALYSAHATSTGGRTGSSRTDDGRLEVTLDTPRELAGNGGPGTNPEQLFAAGYSACFLSALKSVGRAEKIKLPDDTTVAATIHLGENATGVGYGIAADLVVRIPGFERAEAERLVETAHQVCPYSNATRGNIDVTLSVVD